MAVVAQFANTAVLVILGVLVWFYLRGRFELVDRQFSDLKEEMIRRSEQNDRQHERLAADIAAARSDITQIALMLGARSRPEANEA